MNYSLFVDNFRGFSDTCIPIVDVNFLVGENSTGKSSVLSLIKLLSGPDLLMRNDFADEDIGLSHFADMVSAYSDDQSQFRVGLASEMLQGRGKDRRSVVVGCLYTFHAHEGQPKVFKATFCRGDQEVTLKFGRSALFSSVKKCDQANSIDQMTTRMRTEWVAEHRSSNTRYEKLPVPKGLVDTMPLLVALSIATEASSIGKKGEFREFTLNASNFGFAVPELIWFGPIRTKPRRTYDEPSLEFSSEGRHTPYLIRKMLGSRAHAMRLKEFIERIGKASGLFREVRTKSFGRGALARFELDIVLDDKAMNILDVGYGVSQSLPIIVELLARSRSSWFAIQEPEIHLHPRAQAALGDAVFEMAAIDDKGFLIETHSDFAIDRFRMNYRKSRAEKPSGQILFFEHKDRRNVVTPMPIDESGELPGDQPQSYREFFLREQMNLLKI